MVVSREQRGSRSPTIPPAAGACFHGVVENGGTAHRRDQRGPVQETHLDRVAADGARVGERVGPGRRERVEAVDQIL